MQIEPYPNSISIELSRNKSCLDYHLHILDNVQI